MKKLMIAASAALCATVGLALESANVVGYTSADLQEYGLTAGACFVPVSGNMFDLTELKVTGYEEASEGDLYIQTLDEYGRTVATYNYIDIPGEITGWLDESDEPIEAGVVEFQAGEGLWTFSNTPGLGLQSAGQVPQTGVAVTLQLYGLSVANPSPVTVDLTDVSISGYEEASEGDLYIQTLDEYGRTVATYNYIDLPGEITGWLDESDEPIEAGVVVLKPGEGIWAFSNTDGLYLNFPGVAL